jgi:YD repeat-containing protein
LQVFSSAFPASRTGACRTRVDSAALPFIPRVRAPRLRAPSSAWSAVAALLQSSRWEVLLRRAVALVVAQLLGCLVAQAETIGATRTGVFSDQWSTGGDALIVPYPPHEHDHLTVRLTTNPFRSSNFIEVARRFCAQVRLQPKPLAYCGGRTPEYQASPIPGPDCKISCGEFSGPDSSPGEHGGLSVQTKRVEEFSCPPNQNWTLIGESCWREDCQAGFVRSSATGQCLPKREDPPPPPDLCSGNPINAGTGAKHQRLEIFGKASAQGFGYAIAFASQIEGVAPTHLHGANWMGDFERRLIKSVDATFSDFPQVVSVRRPGGHLVSFQRQADNSYKPKADVADRLARWAASSTVESDAWLYTDANANTIEHYQGSVYDGFAKLVRVFHAGGPVLGVSYDGGRPNAVSLDAGRYVALEYDASQRISVARVNGEAAGVSFAYDALGNLGEVRWQDGATRRYLYEDGRWPNSLTGVVDEKGKRFASWSYDAQGRAINSQHAGGAGEVSIVYEGSSSTEIDSFGAARVRQLTTIEGKTRAAGISQPGGSGCSAASSALAYDAVGNVASRDDFAGRRACFTFLAGRNLEASRVEGLANSTACSTVTPSGATLPAGSRKISTRWHPDWSLEAGIAEPGRLTTLVHNGQPDPFNGNALASCAPAGALPDSRPIAALCKRVEQATTDADGSKGFAATLQSGVASRVSTWTYNDRGQVLTATEPATGATTYAYSAGSDPGMKLGDLMSVTNALGHQTRFTSYDARGALLQSVEPSGAVTNWTYDPRGQAATVSVTPTGGAPAQTTTYARDPAGLLQQITLPGGGVRSYRYDDAQRLIGITDAAGNKVDYTLDLRGNRVREDFKTPGGAVTRSVVRVYDALNRLERVTGAAQ